MTKYLFVCLMLVGSCFAQFGAGAATTVVSATVTDANGTPYSFGSYAASFTGFAGNTPNPPTSLSGAQLFKVPFSQASTSAQTGKLDQNGSFTVTLLDNSQIIPANTQWSFTICALDGFTCFVSNQTISGATQSLTTALSAAAVPWYHATYKSLKLGAGGLVFPDGTHQTTAAGGANPAGSQFDTQVHGATNVLDNVAAPTTNCDHIYLYHVTASVAVKATTPCAGVLGRAITGSATTDTVLFSDNAQVIDHDVAGSAGVTETLPTATTLVNANFVFAYTNHSTHTDTITPTTWTIQQGANAAASTLSVASGVSCRISVDPNSSTNWLADCNNAGGSSSPTQTALVDGATITWSPTVDGSTASVTLAGNRTLNIGGNPIGNFTLHVTQDGTGSRTLTGGTYNSVANKIFSAANGLSVLPLSTTAAYVDDILLDCDGTNCYASGLGKQYTAAAILGCAVGIAQDNFAGSSLSANWTVTQGSFIVASATVAPGTSGKNAALYNAATFTSNQCAKMTVQTFDVASSYIGPAVRVQAGANQDYRCIYHGASATVFLQLENGGAETTIASGSQALTAGDTLEIDAVGTTITCLWNGGSILSGTDATLSGGKAGIAGNDNGSGTPAAGTWIGGNK